MLELLGKTSIDFMGKRVLALGLSGLLVAAGLLAMMQVVRGQANLGIDFSGGTSIQIKFDRPVEIGEARRALAESGVEDAELQELTSERALLIRVKRQSALEEKTAKRIVDGLTARFSDNPLSIEGTTEIGPSIGRKLRDDAVLAIAIAMVGILLYIAMRFEFRFGVAAAIATVHDVLAVLGIMYLLDREITLLVVTAFLTLAGYSLTDTVVVFDRIRENLRRRRQEKLHQVINASINQVLSRTVIVSLTTFLAVLALYLWGGDVLHDFAFALLLGVVIGTYSSIFVASPLLFLWRGSRRA